jgi:hypothetical protein
MITGSQKPVNPTMNRILNIAVSVYTPRLLYTIAEQLAARRTEKGYGREILPYPWKAFETGSAETFINGTITLEVDNEETIQVPFITGFLFTCARVDKDTYQLNWSFSMN